MPCTILKPSVSSHLQQTDAYLVVGLNPENKPGYREVRTPEATEPNWRFLLAATSADPAPACIGGMEIDRLSTRPEARRRELPPGIASKLSGQVVRQTGQRGNGGDYRVWRYISKTD